MKPRRIFVAARLSLPLASALVALLSLPMAKAASDSWNVDAAGNWSANGSWLSGTQTPGSTTVDNTDIATFSRLLTAARIVTVDTNRYIGGITLGAGNTSAFGYTLATGNIRLNSGGVIQTTGAIGANTTTISAPLLISGTTTATATVTSGATTVANGVIAISGTVTGSNTAATTTALTLNGTGTGANLISGVIANGSGGALSLAKSGAGTWRLNGQNSYTGNITISGGTLVSGAGTNTANPTVGPLGNPQTAARTVTLGSTNVLSFSGNDSLGNGLSTPVMKIINNAGTINNTGAFFNTLGPVDLNGGTISSVGGVSATYPSFLLNGTITVGGSAVSTISGSGTNSPMGLASAGTTFNVADAVAGAGSDLNVSVVLANVNSVAGILTKSGVGTMVLSGANTYTGATTVSAGTLRAGNAAAFGTTAGGVSITSGAAVDLNGQAIGAEAFTLNGTGISSGGALFNSNATAASVGGAATLGSATRIVPGTGNITLGSTLGMSTFALTKAGVNTLTLSGVVSGTTANGTTSMAVTAGTLILGSTANTFSGNLTVDGSSTVLQINGATRNSTSGPFGIFTGGTGYKTVTLSNGGIFRPNVSYNVDVPSAGLPGNGQVFSIGTGGGTFDVPTGVTLTLDDGSGAGTATTNAQLQGSGTLTKTGVGTLSLGNSTSNYSASFTGAIIVSAGTLTTGAASTNPFGSTGAGTSISAGAALNVAGIVVDELEPLTLAGTGLTGAAAGALTSSTGSAGSWAGPITIATGGATIGGGGGALTLSSGATVNTAGNTLTLRHVTGNQTFSGVISGIGNVVVAGSGSGVVVPNAAHTYTGGTSLDSGTVAIGLSSTGSAGSPTNGPFGAGATPLILSGTQLRSGVNGPFTIGNTVSIAANTTFFSVASERSLIFSGPATITGASRTLTSDVGTNVATASTIFNGAIGDGGNGFGLTKAGTGNLTLAGANTYTGDTIVNAGALVLSGSLPTNTALSISPTIAGGASFSLTSGTANPLSSVSALTIGSATGPTSIGLELGADTAASDSINTPNAATTSGTVNISILPIAGFGSASTYDLITAPSGLAGATYALTNAPGGYTYSLTTSATLVQLGVTPISAGDLYWRGNTSNSWSTFSGSTTNWFTDAAGTTNAQATPGAGNTVNFSAANASSVANVITTTLDNNFTVKNLVFTDSPNGVLAVNVAGGLTPSLVPGILAVAPTSSADGINVASNAGNVTISAPVILGANQTWSAAGTGANGSTLTVSGAITGTATLDISGLVTLSAPATSTYSGATTVPNGAILQGGATNSFSASSAVTVSGTGILRMNGFSNTIASLAGDGTVQNNSASTAATLTAGDATDTTFSGVLQNGAVATLGLTKAGAGKLTLSGANTHTGATTVSAGTLLFGTATTLTSTNPVTVSGTGTLDLNGFSPTIGTLTSATATGTITNSGAGAGTDTLAFTNGGNVDATITNGATRTVALRVTNELLNFRLTNASNTFSGGIVLTNSVAGTRLSAGTVVAGSYGTGAITIGETATDRAGIYFSTATQTLTNPIIFNTALGNDRVGIRTDVAGITLSGVITANLAPVTFTGNPVTPSTPVGFIITNQVTGANGVVLDITSLSATSAAFSVVLNNATINPNNYQGDTVINFNAATAKNATLQLLAPDQIPNGSGKGNVIVNSNSTGIGLLSLAAGNETINGLSGSGNVASTSGTVTLTLGDNDANGNHSGAINNTAGTLSVTKIGSGTQTLSGASNFGGALSVNGGLVVVPSSPATAGPLGNSTVVNLSGGGISHTASGASDLNRPIAIGASAGTLDVASATGSLTISTVTSSSGNLIKTGSGTAVISGVSGITTLNGGAAGVAVNEGTLRAGYGTAGIATASVGAAGSLDLRNSAQEALVLGASAGALTLTGGAQVGFELNGANNDSIAVGIGGTAVTSGVVTLNFFGTPAAGTYTLLTADSGLSGATYALGSAPNGFNYTINASDTVVSVTVSAYIPTFWRGGSDLSWNNLGGPVANWTDAAGTTNASSTPLTADTVIFSAAGVTPGAINTTLDAAFTVDSLQFTNIPGSSDVTIAAGTGGTLTLSPVSTSGGIRVLSGGGNAVISAPLTIATSQTWDVDTTGSLTISGDTAFTSNVNKTNTGVLTLSGNNSGAGAFTLSAGTLNLNSATAVGTGTFTIGAGTTINTAAANTLTNNNVQNWGGDFTFTGTNNLNLGTGAVTMGSTLSVTTSASTLTVGGNIGDGGNNRGLTKAGGGTMILNGANTYGGLTNLTGGILRITTATGLGAVTGGVTQSGSSALELDGTGGAFTVGAEALTINGGGISNGGALRNLLGDNTYGGTVTMAAQSRINSDSGTLTLSNPASVNSANLNLVVGGAGNTTISGAIALGSGGVNKADGIGSLTLSGTNTFTGNTTLSSGTLNITGSWTGNTTGSTLALGGTAANTVTNVSGNITAFGFQGGTVNGAVAVYNQTAGLASFAGNTTTAVQLASGQGSYGYLNITGGTFKSARRFGIAQAQNVAVQSTGVVYVGGTGLLDLTNSEWSLNYSHGHVTVAGSGVINRTGATNPYGIIMNSTVSGGQYGVLNVAGGSFLTTTQPIQFGNSATAGNGNNNTALINVAGGTLQVGVALATNLPSAGANSGYINFAGGTLKTSSAITNWIPTAPSGITFTTNLYGAIDNSALSGAPSFTGGMIFDSNGFDSSLGTVIAGATGDGVAQSSLTLTGGGGSGYIGAPEVVFTGGTLAAGGSPAAGYALINAGAVTGIVITSPGSYTVAPSVALIGGGGTGAGFTVGTLVPNTASGLTKNGTGTLTLSGANTYTGATTVNGGRLQLNGSAAGTPTTNSVTVGAAGTLGFTAGAASTLDLSGKPLTLSGGTLNFDVGASGINDAITVQDFTLTANSALTFNSLGGLSEGGSYTLLTSANTIANSGPFTLTGQTIGRVTLTPTINANTITVATSVDESQWGVDGNGNWSLAGNWTGYLPETAGDAALFGSAITAPVTVTVDTPQSVGYIRFNNANAYTIGSSGSSFLTLNNGASPAVVTVSSGSHTIAENVLLSSNLTAVPAASTTLTMSGVISGASRNVEVNGPGTVVLSGVNTYNGTHTVRNGALTLSGNRTTTVGSITVGDLLSTTGTLNISNGTFTTGTVNVGLGTNAATAGIVNQTGGILTMSGNQVLLGNGGTGTASGSNSTGTYNLSNGTLNTIAGLGVTIGTNTGTTGVFNLSGTGTLTMAATSTMQIARSDNSAATNTTGTFTQTGGTATVGILQMSGTAAAAVNGAGGNSTLTLTGGTFAATTFNALSGGNNSSSTITIGGTAQATLPGFPTNAKGTAATATLTLDSTTGFLRPTATNASYLPSGTFNSGAKLTANGAKLDTNGFDITIGQVLEDDSTLGTLTKSGLGNLTLAGVNTYTGTTTISAGTLTINEGSIATSSNIVNNGALAYVLNTNARTYANAITGSGSLTKSGTNSLTLSGSNSYTGATNASGGTLTISGATNTGSSNVTVGSGSAGAMTVSTGGSFTTTGGLFLGSGAIGNTLTVQTGATMNVGSITNTWGSSYAVSGTLTSAGAWSVSTNRTTDTFNGSGTISAASLTLGNASTGVNYTGTGAINLTGAVTVACNFNTGTPFYTQSSGTLNAGSILLGDNQTNTTGSRTFNLSGGRVNIGAGGIASTGTTTATRIVNLGTGTLGASANWSSSLPMNLTTVAGVTINTLDSVDGTTARTITLSGVLSGTSNSLTKDGDGILVLSATNTYTGPTTITAGTIQLGDAGTTGALAATSAITNNGNLTINRSNAANQGTGFGTISGTGSLTQAGSGTTTLNAANSYTGSTTITAGILSVSADNNLGTAPGSATPASLVINGGTLTASAGFTLDSNRGIALGTTGSTGGTIGVTAGTLSYGGIIANNGGTNTLTKTGAGILELSGANTYSGSTTITGGTVQISAADNLGDASATNTISLGAATLRSTANTYDLGANRAITLTGAGVVRVDAGILTLSGDISNGVNGLALRGGGSDPLTTGKIVITGVIGTGATPTGGLTIGLGASGLSANVTLSGNNLFTGNVTLSGSNTQPYSILTLTNSGALGVGPKTVQAAGGGEIHLQNNITFAAGINFTTSGNPTQNGVSTNRAVIYNDSGNNTINGNISLGSGNGGTTIASDSGLLTLNGNITATAVDRQLVLRGNGDGLISGVISNGSTAALPLLKDAGTGTWTLSGANTYTGATTVSVGTLALVGGSQASPITVSTDASLSFTLGSSTSSTSTFNLTNGTIKINGTPTLPSYTLISASTGITGTPTLDAPIAGYVLKKVGNTLVLENPYEVWAAATGATGGKAADPDGDGFNNLMEYAFGTNPTVNSAGSIAYSGGAVTATGQPVLEEDGGIFYAVFGRRTDYAAAGLTYTVEFTAGLDQWTPSVTVPTVVATDGTIDAVRVPFPNSVGSPSGPKKPYFFRVEIAD